MSDNIPFFRVERVAGCHPEIGLWLAILDDARSRLLPEIQGLTGDMLDAPPAIGTNTIGELLYHVAMADVNWLYDNLLQVPYPDDIKALFPQAITDETGHLAQVRGHDLAWYLGRLATARLKVHEVFKALSIEEFRAMLRRVEPDREYAMTAEAVLQHLAQHEAEHRGEIQLLIAAQGQAG